MDGDPDATTRLVYWLLLVVVLGLIGIATVLALMAAWRNFHRRQRALEQGRRTRLASRGEAISGLPTDIWTEAGRRYHEPELGAGGAAASEGGPDAPDHPDHPDNDAPPTPGPSR